MENRNTKTATSVSVEHSSTQDDEIVFIVAPGLHVRISRADGIEIDGPAGFRLVMTGHFGPRCSSGTNLDAPEDHTHESP